MGLFDGKKGIILGVANNRSIAWAAAEFIMQEGGECGFNHLPDRPDDERQRNRRRVAQLTENLPAAKFLVPMDVCKDADIAAVMAKAAEVFGKIDFVLHSMAFATLDDLKQDTLHTSRDGFKLAMEISAYSLIAVAKHAAPVMNDNGSICALTYLGGERCVPGYNVMGICKAALDCSVMYLAHDLGPRGIRVNAVSAGPLKTLASSAVGADDMQPLYEQIAPLTRCVTHGEVARSVGYLLSEMSGGITAEILHVDGGYNKMGTPGRMLDRLKQAGVKV